MLYYSSNSVLFTSGARFVILRIVEGVLLPTAHHQLLYLIWQAKANEESIKLNVILCYLMEGMK